MTHAQWKDWIQQELKKILKLPNKAQICMAISAGKRE